MKAKGIVIIILVLLLTQAWMFGDAANDDSMAIERSIERLDTEIRQMSTEKKDLDKRFKMLRQDIKSIPPSLLAGFEDPEASFVEFLDYIQSSAFVKAGGEVTMKGQSFSQSPIPLHVGNFDFSYSFGPTNVAEEFIDTLTGQRRFPLQVRGFSVQRHAAAKTGGTVSVSLLIPAKLKLDLPSFAEKSEGK